MVSSKALTRVGNGLDSNDTVMSTGSALFIYKTCGGSISTRRAVRRAAHFLSGVAGLIGASELERAANAVQSAKGDAGGLRAVETMLTLAFEARGELGAAA